MRAGVILVAMSYSGLDHNVASLAMGDDGGRVFDEGLHMRAGTHDRAGHRMTESVMLGADGAVHDFTEKTLLAEFGKHETRIARQQQRLRVDQVRDCGGRGGSGTGRVSRMCVVVVVRRGYAVVWVEVRSLAPAEAWP